MQINSSALQPAKCFSSILGWNAAVIWDMYCCKCRSKYGTYNGINYKNSL